MLGCTARLIVPSLPVVTVVHADDADVTARWQKCSDALGTAAPSAVSVSRPVTVPLCPATIAAGPVAVRAVASTERLVGDTVDGEAVWPGALTCDQLNVKAGSLPVPATKICAMDVHWGCTTLATPVISRSPR